EHGQFCKEEVDGFRVIHIRKCIADEYIYPLTLKTTFFYDTAAPDAEVTSPAGNYISSGGNIEGTSADPTLGETDSVFVRLQREDNNKYWKVSASSWSTGEVWNSANLSADGTYWYLNNPTPDWEEISDGYEVNVKAKDKAANYQSIYDTATFKADFSAPSSTIALPAEGWSYDNLPDIKGTSSDNFIVNKIRVDIERVGAGDYHWNDSVSTWTETGGSAYFNDQNIGAASSYWTFSVNIPTNCWEAGESYIVTVHAVDGANAEEGTTAYNQKSFSFTARPTVFKMSISATGDPVAGVSYDITGTAWDENNVAVASAYREQVHFTSDDGAAVLPGDYTFTTGDSGVHSWTVADGDGIMFKTAGSKYLKIEDADSDPNISTSTTYNVLPGAIDNFSLTLLPTGVTAGSAEDLKVTAKDAYGNTKTNYVSTITFTWGNDGDATVADYPDLYKFESGDNGEHLFSSSITFKTANIGVGNASNNGWDFRVEDSEDPGVYGVVNNIICSPGTRNRFEVTMDTGPWSAGFSGKKATVTVEALDAYDNRLSTGTNLYNKTYTKTVSFTSSDGQATLPADYDFTTGPGGDNGYYEYNASVILKTAGNQSVTADDGTISGSQTGIGVNAGNATGFNVSMSQNVDAGSAENITITAEDDYGNTDTDYTGTIDFDSDNGNWTDSGLYAFIGYNDGYKELPTWVTLKESTYENGAEFQVEVFEQGTPAKNGFQNNIDVTAASASGFLVSGIDDPTDAGVKNSVSVEVNDSYGNRALVYDGVVTFTSDDASATFPGDHEFTTDVDQGNKVFSSTVVFETVGLWYFKAEDVAADGKGVDGITGQQSNIDVDPAVATSFSVTASTNQVIDEQFDFTVTAKDSYGNTVTDYSGEVDFYSDASDYTFALAAYQFMTYGAGIDDGSHSFTGTDGVEISTSGSYYIEANDAVNSIDGQQTGIYVTTRPDSKLTFPSDNDNINALTPPAIAGTLYDDEAISEVKIKILKGSDQWDESIPDWVSYEYWNDCNVYSSSWTYTATEPGWISGGNFKIVSRAKDNKDNFDITLTTITFLFDNDDPVTVFTAPTQDGHRNTVPFRVEGTALDEPANDSGLAQLKLRVTQILTDGTTEYWDEFTKDWVTTPVWVTEAAGTYWIQETTPTWNDPSDGLFYRIYTYHKDFATNIESTKTVTFIYDETAPDSYLGKPDSAFENDISLAKIWGTSVDHPDPPYWNAGVNAVQVRISSGPLYWDGNSYENLSPANAWQNAGIWTSSWTYTSVAGAFVDGSSFTVNCRAIDNTTSDGTSNPNTETSISTASFIYDTTDPQSWMDIPDAAQTYETMDSVYGTTSDDAPGDINYVKIRIQQVTGGSYDNAYWDWNSNTWETSPVQEWSDAINPSGVNWSKDTSGVSWEATASGVDYKTWAVAYDKAANSETVDAGTSWTFTSPYPQTRVTDPAGLSIDPDYYYEPSTIDGTADAYTNDNKAYVIISSAPSFGTFWDNDTETWSSIQFKIQIDTNPSVSFPGSWQATISTNVWQNTVEYKVWSTGEGPAGWQQSPSDYSQYFYIDRDKPDSFLQDPANGDHKNSGIATISGTSEDISPGEMGALQLRIQYGANYYDGAKWVGVADTWLNTTVNDGTFDEQSEDWTWTVTYPTEAWKNEGSYYIRTRAKDSVQPTPNQETSYGVADIVVDDTLPTSAITAPSTYFYKSLPLIKGTGEDTSPGIWTALTLRIKNKDTTNYWSGSGWVPDSNNW
ncbi:MAG: hypothetical protein PF545_00325, partial [Elusimicrobia bacterium]|nr:hypothetical protein [Elusimicrobiota bacterium]